MDPVAAAWNRSFVSEWVPWVVVGCVAGQHRARLPGKPSTWPLRIDRRVRRWCIPRTSAARPGGLPGGGSVWVACRNRPFAFAIFMPSLVRSRIRSASNSATSANTLNNNRPTGSVGSYTARLDSASVLSVARIGHCSISAARRGSAIGTSAARSHGNESMITSVPLGIARWDKLSTGGPRRAQVLERPRPGRWRRRRHRVHPSPDPPRTASDRRPPLSAHANAPRGSDPTRAKADEPHGQLRCPGAGGGPDLPRSIKPCPDPASTTSSVSPRWRHRPRPARPSSQQLQANKTARHRHW